MPTPIQSAEKMSDGGKHWTSEEIEQRKAAEESVKRRRRVSLKPPAWLSEDALGVWKEMRKKLAGMELLDNLDTEMLAVYCDAIVKYRDASKVLSMVDEDGVPMATDERVKAAQAWARIICSFAEKLGLTPGGRARLAKKKAEKVEDPFAKTFGG